MKIRFLLCICLVLSAAGLIKAGSEETEYFAVFMDGKKVGHAIHNRIEADGKVTSSEKVSITISRVGVPVTINMTETSIETAGGKPLGFEVIQELGVMIMNVAGTVDPNGTVNVTAKMMGNEQKSTLQWPSGAMMTEALEQLTRKQGLNEGTAYTARLFSPSIMQALDAKISIGPNQTVDLLGRVVTLTEVKTTFTMPLAGAEPNAAQQAGEMASTSYVDKDYKVQKSIIPIVGIQVEMIACPKEFALGQNDVFEVIDKMLLASPQPLGDVNSAKSIVYILSPVKEANNLMIPSGDNQKVQRLENGKIMVTVEPVTAPAGVAFPYRGKDEKILEATKPTRFLQSDNEKIIDLARRAVGDTKDAAEAVKRIEAFVADYIEYKNLSIGYASALEVADSRQGDCTEHAVLTAALCRAVGIPAQVVTGIAYVKEFANVKDIFGGHAWVQAYIGQDNGKLAGAPRFAKGYAGGEKPSAAQWIGLDAAFKGTGRGGYGPGHIALAVGNGNPEDFLNIATTLGRFKIEIATVYKQQFTKK